MSSAEPTAGDEHVSFDVDESAEPNPDYEAMRLTKRTLTTINLRAALHAQEDSLATFIMNDFWSNLTVVTFPACFTNTLWRGMNLNGIAVKDNPIGVIWDTTWKIATAVFLLCSIIDMLRQLFISYRDSRSVGENAPFSIIWNRYIMSGGWRSSLNLGWKFLLGVVGWTVGYELEAGSAQLLQSTHDSVIITQHAIGAGIGTTIGLWLACESITQMDFLFFKIGETPNHRGSMGVAVKGFLEGFVWSVIADNNVYLSLTQKGMVSSSANFFDSVAVGFGSSPFFTLTGVFTSICGYYYLRWLSAQAKSQNYDYDAIPSLDD